MCMAYFVLSIFLTKLPPFVPTYPSLSFSIDREVMELADGSLPFVHLSTECHCPPSHPVVDIDSETRCIQHTGTNLVNRGSVERINPLAHPPGFINDFATGPDNGWISAPGDRQANVTLTLTHSLYEVSTVCTAIVLLLMTSSLYHFLTHVVVDFHQLPFWVATFQSSCVGDFQGWWRDL